MILQSLHGYYHRLAEDPESGIPKPGYSIQNIAFRVVISLSGQLVAIQDARLRTVEADKKGKEKIYFRPTPTLVPGQTKPPGQGLNPCFLWDNPGYMLGYKVNDDNPERTKRAFESFRDRHLNLRDEIATPEFSAVCAFLRDWDPAEAAKHSALTDVGPGFGVFQISGEPRLVHDAKAIRKWWEGQQAEEPGNEQATCLITGQSGAVALLHEPAIKGVNGSLAGGAKIVSFNERAYESYGKNEPAGVGQGRNAPVSKAATFAYCNALNHLLASGRRIRLGDASVVFWTDRKTNAEALLPCMLDSRHLPENDELKTRLASVLGKMAKGRLSSDDLGDASTPYFLLGLSPNSSRLSVRFWLTGTLGDLAANLHLHLDHLGLVRQWNEKNSKHPDPLAPSVFQLLLQTSRDADGIPPLLGGALIRSIILGTRYPEMLATAVLRRVRASREPNYLSAAILKSWLVRNHNQEYTTMLDKRKDAKQTPAYRLGRLFAVLERVQEDSRLAQSGVRPDKTIRHTFFASACSTPGVVFPRLEKLSVHHQRQLPAAGRKGQFKGEGFYSREISEIKLWQPATKRSHTLVEQGEFILGYYHERHFLFTGECLRDDDVADDATSETIE